jgi:hypothetical protein
MITYTWTLGPLAVKLADDGLTNVVDLVNWRLVAAEDSYSENVYGSVNIPPPSGSFTPYDDLTEEQVQGWVESALGAEQVASYKDALARQIELQKNPIDAVLPPPWQ